MIKITKSSIAITRIVFVCCFLLFDTLHAQNLVPNGSFEDKWECPTALAQFSLVKQWFSANSGTPDYFNECSEWVSVPKNSLGSQLAHTGSAYVGVITLDKYSDIVEYIQTALTKPLEEGKVYKFKMYVCLAENVKYAMSGISAYFSVDKIHKSQWVHFTVSPQINNPKDSIITNREQWTLICGDYKALGGEKYITIGNFGTGETEDKTVTNDRIRADDVLSYYYIDDVSLEAIQTPITLFVKRTIPSPFGTLNEGSIVTFKSVLFDFDKTTLLPASKIELNRLCHILKKYPQLEIEIRGHTDSLGTIIYNAELSSKRANAIADFLIENGIEPTRLLSKGYGSEIPIATNISEQGRKANRRVEFKVVKL